MRVAFLDRDGTIICDYPDEEWRNIREPVFIEGVFDALRHIKRLGYEIIIATNQYLIGEGIISQLDYYAFNEKFLNTLRAQGIDVLDVFFCPHARSSHCNCCKPKPGLIQQALDKYPDIDPNDSFMAGDSRADMQLAEDMGLKFVGVGLECPKRIPSIRDINTISL